MEDGTQTTSEAANGAPVAVRSRRSMWLPPLVSVAIGALLGMWVGNAEVANCGSHLGPAGLVLGTWFLALAGAAFAVLGLVVAGVGKIRNKRAEVQGGLGVFLAGIALPISFFVVTWAVRAAGCSF